MDQIKPETGSTATKVPEATVTAQPASPPPIPKNQVTVRAGHEVRALIPTTMQEAWVFCQNMAKSFNLPQAFYVMPKMPQGWTEKVNMLEVATARAMHALQLGMEVGLPPAQAIQSIVVMNGVGTIWGDAQLALVMNSGLCEHFSEYTEGEMWLDAAKTKPNPKYTWVCESRRVGRETRITRFTIEDAIRAELWGKRGKSYDGQPGKASSWITHPNRMGQYKARAFNLRDNYPDVLKGLVHSVEEMEGEIIEVNEQPKAPERFAETLADPKYQITDIQEQPVEIPVAPSPEPSPEQELRFEGETPKPKAKKE